MNVSLSPATKLEGSPRLPGDKSISHRALLFAALAKGSSRISHLLDCADVRSTLECLRALGVECTPERVIGRGLRGFRAPEQAMSCGNSGTTMRLMMGILAAQPFSSVLTGDASLSGRPMNRIALPLRKMGAEIRLQNHDHAPVGIRGTSLSPIRYELPVASAQLKTALLLAGLYPDGETVLSGKIQGRDHTERLLPLFGAQLNCVGGTISIRGGLDLNAADVVVPADISTAAFFIAGAALLPHSEIELHRVGLNPSRTGILSVLKRMGADYEIETETQFPEPTGTIRVRSSRGKLAGVTIDAAEIPTLVDELPVIAILATQAEGLTTVRGARELRVKETDRIEAIAENLRAMGGEIEVFEDGFSIRGPQKLRGATIHPHGDHRIAMSFSVAALIAEGNSEITEAECVAVSYPDFFRVLKEVAHG